MLKESKVAIISAILEDFCKRIQGRRYLSNPGQAGVSLPIYIVSQGRCYLSNLERICVKGIQGRRYLSNLGGFVLKESKVAVISAILEDLC